MGSAGGTDVIGRDAEIADLEAFAAASSKAPAALILSGEAGIGKTTLWRRGLETARARSINVLEASAAEAESKLSFSVLFDLLDRHLGEVLPKLPPPQRRALEVALLLRSAEGKPPDQRAVGTATLNAVRMLAAVQPVMLAVDDLQWIDASSAAVLAFAVRRLKQEPVLLLLAQRSTGEPPSTPALERALTGISVRRLAVGPLSLGATHWLLSERLHVAFSRSVLRRLYQVSGGNPFFALELAHGLGRAGDVEPGQPLPVPDSLTSLVGERLARLPQATQEALLVAATLFKPRLGLIAEVIGTDAAECLAPAVDVGVAEIAGGQVRFAHPLLASAAYELASPARRRQLHRLLSGMTLDIEERAHHLALAADQPDEGIAAVLDGAADRASGRGAQDAAADLFAQARLLTPPDAGDAIRRRGLREAECALESGDTPRARRLLEALLVTTDAGRGRAEVLLTLARVHFNGLDWRQSVGLLEQALSDAGDDDYLRAQIELHLAINLDLLRRNVAETLEHARVAVALAEQLGDKAMLGEALILEAKAELLLGLGWPDRLVARSRKFEAAMRSLPADRWLNDYLATMQAWADDLDGAIAALDLVAATAQDQGDDVSLNWALARAAELNCHVGRWNVAMRHIDRGAEIAIQAGQQANEAIFLGLRALVEAHCGYPAPARDAAARALQLGERAGAAMARRAALAANGLLELSLGRPREASAHLEELTAETRAAGVGEPGAMRFLPDAIEALIDSGRLQEAGELLGFLDERAQASQRASGMAAADRCRGLLAAARGKPDEALTELAAALRRYADLPLPFDRARTLLALGRTQRRTGQRRAARGSLSHTLAAFEALGARRWAEVARAELARIGGRSPSPGTLSVTERRVAELAAEGLSNKEIAAQLFVTPKTVETTLSRVYSKLDIHSRAQLARQLAGLPAGKV